MSIIVCFDFPIWSSSSVNHCHPSLTHWEFVHRQSLSSFTHPLGGCPVSMIVCFDWKNKLESDWIWLREFIADAIEASKLTSWLQFSYWRNKYKKWCTRYDTLTALDIYKDSSDETLTSYCESGNLWDVLRHFGFWVFEHLIKYRKWDLICISMFEDWMLDLAVSYKNGIGYAI